jgi:iron complex transport system ATP-binding protein
MKHISLNNLSVGYDNRTVAENINIDFMKGRMTCILGPNGSGKTTILKTMARIISAMDGTVSINGMDLSRCKQSRLAKEMSVVLTNRIDLENMSGFDVAAMGRYPYTGFLGILSREDRDIVKDCLECCSAGYLGDMEFNRMSDGEKQKILIARGLAQATDIILLDEPTCHLDIKYKLDVLTTLKKRCINEGKTVICTLHEPEFAIKCCDYLVLVKEEGILTHGYTDDVVAGGMLDELYGFSDNQFNSEIGIIEFTAVDKKDVFIIGADEGTVSLYRSLNRSMAGFAAGVLHKNDICYHIARTMNSPVIATDAYIPVSDGDISVAYALAKEYKHILLSNFSCCELNRKNLELARMLEGSGKEVLHTDKGNMKAALSLITSGDRGG